MVGTQPLDRLAGRSTRNFGKPSLHERPGRLRRRKLRRTRDSARQYSVPVIGALVGSGFCRLNQSVLPVCFHNDWVTKMVLQTGAKRASK
jgi:hypothetical protein